MRKLLIAAIAALALAACGSDEVVPEVPLDEVEEIAPEILEDVTTTTAE